MARKFITFSGNNGIGNISVPGVKAGDQILAIANDGALNSSNLASSFFSIVITDDEIRQIATNDFSSYTFSALLQRELLI